MIDQAPIVGDYAVASSPSTTAVLEAPSYISIEAPVALGVRAPSRHRVRRFVVAPLLVAFLLVCALLAYEGARPRPVPVNASAMLLHEQSLAGSFSVDVPLRWEFVVGDPRTAVFTDPDQPDSSHGMRVIAANESLAKAHADLKKLDGDLVSSYRPIRTVTGIEVGGRPAFRHDFTGDGTAVEQWWVQRGKGTFRIDLFARPDLAEETQELNERIVSTFREL